MIEFVTPDSGQATVRSAAEALLDADVTRYGLEPAGDLYDAMLRYLTELHFHAFRLDELPLVTGDATLGRRPLKLLDLGCGPGTLVLSALQRGHDAYGIDLGDAKLALANAWMDALGMSGDARARLALHDAGDLPFADASFDVVTSYHVLEHVADLPSVLHEAVRVTKRGGWLDLRAPDYRMSYDTHYCMPWPRFMPPAQAREWTRAMGRPADGIGTFFYVTAPQVVAILESLGCRIQQVLLREHQRGHVRPFSGNLQIDPIVTRSGLDMTALADELKRSDAAGTLPAMYSTCLEFTIAAQRI